MSQGGASGPTVQLAASRKAICTRSARDGRRVTAPAHAALAGVEPKERTLNERAGLGQGIGAGPGDEQAGGGEGTTPVPVGVVGGPGAIPSESVAKNQPAGAADLEILDDPLELESLRQLAAVVAAGQPDVAPDQAGRGASSTRPR